MLGQRNGGLAGTLPDKSCCPLALPSSGGLGDGEGDNKCSVGGNHIGGAKGGGDRRDGGVDGHDGTRGQSTSGGGVPTRGGGRPAHGGQNRADLAVGAAAIGGSATWKEAPAAALLSLTIRGGARKEGAPVVASSSKGEERVPAAASSPPTVEPSGGAVVKREEGGPAAVSSPHVAELSSGAAGKREEAVGVMKVKTPSAAEPLRPDPAAPTPDQVAAVLDPAATGTC
ncbi:hypothetical protein GUJ93_ZPchr0002g25826 [Zizania palustris]|uniref:Uncharacterized protein n=1 Tax=Zizania palustris TaxID=103762 RepID=A0A8J5SNV7_ZIZPA|nr:hypothetical protein GUJ93_ZPchr0002g24024 [Zizania palustris]KAG8060116.1 hypothetical protein GUJ93_ZPchr0002g25826 [Zizania palustris]